MRAELHEAEQMVLMAVMKLSIHIRWIAFIHQVVRLQKEGTA